MIKVIKSAINRGDTAALNFFITHQINDAVEIADYVNGTETEEEIKGLLEYFPMHADDRDTVEKTINAALNKAKEQSAAERLKREQRVSEQLKREIVVLRETAKKEIGANRVTITMLQVGLILYVVLVGALGGWLFQNGYTFKK